MAAKLAKYIFLSIMGLIAIMTVAVAFINDDTIQGYGGGVGNTIVSAKHGVLNSLGGATNAVGGWVLDLFSGSEGTTVPRVVQDIPPAPTPSTVAKPVETKTLADVAAETQKLYDQRRIETDQPPAQTQATPAPSPQDLITPPPPPMTETAMTSEELTQNSPLPPMMPSSPESQPPAAPETMADMLSSEPPIPENAAQMDEVKTEAPNEEPASSSANDAAASIDTLLEEAASSPPETEPPLSDIPDPTGDEAYAEGLKYYTGEGVERNFGTAAQHFIKAAELGHSGAQYNLGLMNYVGQTGGQDFSNAAKWFQKAAESGHIQAQYNLGFLYYEGKGVQQDLKIAYGWIDRAAQQGYAKAIKARDALKKAMPEVFGS